MLCCCVGNSLIQIFRASGNNISGPLPESLGALSSLMELFLDDNSLTGMLPAIVPGKKCATPLYMLSDNLETCEKDTFLRHVS